MIVLHRGLGAGKLSYAFSYAYTFKRSFLFVKAQKWSKSPYRRFFNVNGYDQTKMKPFSEKL